MLGALARVILWSPLMLAATFVLAAPWLIAAQALDGLPLLAAGLGADIVLVRLADSWLERW